MNTAQWTSAKVVKYREEGLHNAREAVVKGDYEGKADVIDRLTVKGASNWVWTYTPTLVQ